MHWDGQPHTFPLLHICESFSEQYREFRYLIYLWTYRAVGYVPSVALWIPKTFPKAIEPIYHPTKYLRVFIFPIFSPKLVLSNISFTSGIGNKLNLFVLICFPLIIFEMLIGYMDSLPLYMAYSYILTI